jgi:hypothetical protein
LTPILRAVPGRDITHRVITWSAARHRGASPGPGPTLTLLGWRRKDCCPGTCGAEFKNYAPPSCISNFNLLAAAHIRCEYPPRSFSLPWCPARFRPLSLGRRRAARGAALPCSIQPRLTANQQATTPGDPLRRQCRHRRSALPYRPRLTLRRRASADAASKTSVVSRRATGAHAIVASGRTWYNTRGDSTWPTPRPLS